MNCSTNSSGISFLAKVEIISGWLDISDLFGLIQEVLGSAKYLANFQATVFYDMFQFCMDILSMMQFY